MKIKGLVHSPAYPALVYAAEVPAPVVNDGDGFNVAVPVIRGDEEYKVLLIVDGHVLDSEPVSALKITQGEIQVEFKPVTIDPPQYKAEIKPLPPAYQ